MEEVEIPTWNPKFPAIYDINRSYLQNAEDGPFFSSPTYPERTFPPKEKWTTLFGFPIASPIGIPAGPLLNSRWIDAASKLGYDVLTYKTIRSSAFSGHPVPNMIYVNIPKDLRNLKDQTVESTDIIPQDMADLAVTNSFGMPSRDREFLKQDIPKANSLLKDGQVMIVSIVGSTSHQQGEGEYSNFVKDFVETALFAKDCGAKIIEANFSCPNVASGEGCIYQSAQATFDIASAMTQQLGDTPLIIKVGTYEDSELMRNVFASATKAKVAAICGINSVSMKVVHPTTKQPALGSSRLVSGVCGGPIRTVALEFVQNATKIIKEQSLPLTVLGCGGITLPEHFDEFLNAGAKIAMTATGMIWDPYLAARYNSLKTK